MGLNGLMTDASISTNQSPARWPYLAGGYICFALGLLGIVLPLLPTTVFWIGAAACFAKSSPEMYRRIITWPRVGPVIHDFLAFGVIGTGAKKAALIGMGLCAMLIGFLTFGSLAMIFSWIGISIAAVIVISRPSIRPANNWLVSDGLTSCPFLAATHAPFPILQRQLDTRLF